MLFTECYELAIVIYCSCLQCASCTVRVCNDNCRLQCIRDRIDGHIAHCPRWTRKDAMYCVFMVKANPLVAKWIQRESTAWLHLS